LRYNRARYYSPSLGRFISEDPIGFAGGDVNLYAYVGNSPTNAIDPNGTNPLVVGCVVGAAANVGIDWLIANVSGRKYTWQDAGQSALSGCVFSLLGAAGAGSKAGKVLGLSDDALPNPTISQMKKALRKVYGYVGKLPKGEDSKWGRPQRGDAEKGYRFDPPHPPRPGRDAAEQGWHFNYWDYTKGKRNSGGISGSEPIE
jgi:uncharacterized protein RhaS with RHS repeats